MKRSKSSIFFGGALSHSFAQGIGIVTGLLSVPIGLHYLGVTKYGVWMVIQSLLVYLSTSQFGIGTVAAALMTKATNFHDQKTVLFKAFILLACCGFVFLGIIALGSFYPSIWSAVLGEIPFTLKEEAINAALILAFLYLLKLPFIAFSAGFIGLQEVYLERFYVAILPPIFNLLALLLTVHFSGGLAMLSLLVGLVNFAISIISGLHFFIRHQKLIPRIGESLGTHPTLFDMLHGGAYFFVGGLAAMVVWYTDNLVISYFLGPDYVTAYSITFKLFTIAFSVFTVINAALWPMFGRAAGQEEWGWIATTYNNSMLLLPILGGLVWIGGISFSKDIIYLWVGASGYSDAWVVFALGGYGYLLALVNTHASFLGGMNIARPMMWAGISEALVNFALSVYLVKIYGIVGVALGTFLASLITVFWLLPLIIGHQTQGKVKMAWRPFVRHAVIAVLPAVLAVQLINEYFCCGWLSISIRVLLILLYLVISWWLLPSEVSAIFKALAMQKISPGKKPS
jgi:O-antigen/teichoic acid export membrane protein